MADVALENQPKATASAKKSDAPTLDKHSELLVIPQALQLPGRILQAGVTVLVSLVLGFIRLRELPIDARFFIVGGAVALFWLAVVSAAYEVLSIKKSRFRVRSAVAVLIGFAVGAFLLLNLVMKYHSLRIVPEQTAATSGEFAVYPPRTPVSATITFYSTTPGVMITALMPQTTNPSHLPVNANEVELSYIEVRNFYYPQRLAISYELSGAGSLTRIIREGADFAPRTS